MEYNEFAWERQHPLTADAVLTAADIATLTRLLEELRELTQSRNTYAAASALLERFGVAIDTGVLVQPEQLAH